MAKPSPDWRIRPQRPLGIVFILYSTFFSPLCIRLVVGTGCQLTLVSLRLRIALTSFELRTTYIALLLSLTSILHRPPTLWQDARPPPRSPPAPGDLWSRLRSPHHRLGLCAETRSAAGTLAREDTHRRPDSFEHEQSRGHRRSVSPPYSQYSLNAAEEKCLWAARQRRCCRRTGLDYRYRLLTAGDG